LVVVRPTAIEVGTVTLICQKPNWH
jgi:hypothetical protein